MLQQRIYHNSLIKTFLCRLFVNIVIGTKFELKVTLVVSRHIHINSYCFTNSIFPGTQIIYEYKVYVNKINLFNQNYKTGAKI